MSIHIGKNQLLVGAMYAPFCRTKYIDPSEWEKDIKAMREMGYTCLHGFCEWWRIEREKGVFDFSQTDYLLKLCEKYQITPILNVATQNGVGYYMPRWMQNEYRGQGMVDCDGNGLPVHSEYLVPCMDDPWYQMYAQRYIRALASHYAGDQRIGGWVIWGEPFLAKGGKPICYCEHTVARFRKWLEKKYGAIQNLNRVWGNEGPSDYAGFEDVHPPVGQSGQRGSYASWMDWSTFMCDNFSDHIKNADRLFKECGATQPTISELFCYVGGSPMCNDIWQLAETADIVGVSNYLRPGIETDIVMTVANSISRKQQKSFFTVEALGGPRYFNYDKRTPGTEEIRSECVQMMGSGAKGLMYWCYRPRLSDFEGGTFGMCRADGKPLPQAKMAGKVAQQMRRAEEAVFSASRDAEVGILYSSHAVHITGSDNSTQEMQRAEIGAMKMLLDAHIQPLLVDEEMIQKGLPEGIKALLLPFAYAMDDATAAGIAEFVKKGGLVIADQNLAFKRLDGTAYQLLPGGGLDQVFGLEKDDVMYLEHPSLLPAENPCAIPLNAFMDILCLVDAEAVEGDGSRPLITRHAFGAGSAWYFAWQAFASYQDAEGGIAALREKVVGILAHAGVRPFVRVETPAPAFGRLSISLMKKEDGTRIVTVVNPHYEETQVKICLPGAQTAENLLDETPLTAEKAGSDLMLSFHLAGWQSVMLLVR